MCSLAFEEVHFEAAFRPTVKDRRPLLGAGATHPNVFNFNGLGTKGVSLAAWFSKHLLEHIKDQKELMKEVDVKRYDA